MKIEKINDHNVSVMKGKRKRSVFKSKQSSSQLDHIAIIESTPDAIFLINFDYDIIAFNKMAEILLKKFTGVIIKPNMNLIEMLPDSRKQDVQKKLDHVSKGFPIQYEALYPDNNWLQVSFTPVRNQEEKIDQICVTLHNVSNYKNIETTLKQREQQYHSLFNSLAEGVVHISVDRKVTACNSSAEKILGIKKEQLEKSVFPLPEWRLLNYKKEGVDFRNFLNKENGYCRSIKNFILGIQKGEAIQWLSLNIEPVKKENSGMQTCVISFTDITEQEKVNYDLKILSLAAMKITNSVVVTNPQRKIIWINSAFTKNTGYSFEEVKGKVPGHILQGKDTDPKTVKLMRNFLRKNIPFECEIQNYKKSGEKFWMRIQVQALYDNNGDISGYLGVGADITEQKKLQEKLIQQKVEQQKEITRATIMGQEKERNELGRELHDNINQILAATKLQLECHLKSENGRPECINSSYEYIDLAMREIRNLSKHLVSPRFQENKLMDEINILVCGLGLSKKTRLDASQFEEEELTEEIKLTIFRIVQEQFNNIIKYAKAKSILSRLEIKNNMIELIIKDDGVGFDTTQKRNGIGLSNIQNRVELHGGTATIESTPGKGCLLCVSIPLKNPIITVV